MANRSVIIVGAGLAGLGAARILQQRNYTVSIFEARECIGGRVWTPRDGLSSVFSESIRAAGSLVERSTGKTIVGARRVRRIRSIISTAGAP